MYAIRLVFGSAMAVSIILAIRAIRRGDFASHGAWMMRGYAIGLGGYGGTHAPALVCPRRQARGIEPGNPHGSWLGINLLVAEWIIRRRQSRRGVRASVAGVRAPDGVFSPALEWDRRQDAQPSEPT